MSGVAVHKYDPAQAVDLSVSTNSMENSRIPKSVTSKVFSGSVWHQTTPPNQFQHLQIQAAGSSNTMTTLSQSNDVGHSLWPKFNTMSLPEQLKPTSPVRVPRKTYATEARFLQLQKWECTVLEVKEDAFTARLIDQTGSNPDEEAEFSLDEVDTEDRDLVEAGAVFYWSIGYRDRPSGRERISTIRFRRLPVWTPKELRIAAQEAARVREKIGWK
ncbi:MAG: hypothetical protein ABL970_11435 [Nitrospira sp.]